MSGLWLLAWLWHSLWLPSRCETVAECSFELDQCRWYNEADSSYQWMRSTGSSSGTGPSSAHAGQYYLSVEATMTTTQAGSGTQLESVGAGHCSSGQIYSSSAWELGRTSVGVKGFDTPEYEAWVQEAWAKCVEKDAGAKYVSVWTDAGYRCYTATACDPNGASSTRSWESVQVPNSYAYLYSYADLSMESDWMFSFWYYMFGSATQELSLQGLSHGSYTALWDAAGHQGPAWRDAFVVVPSSVSQLRIAAVVGSSDIAIDELVANPKKSFAVRTGSCTSTGACVQSPNFPADYPNDEDCNIWASSEDPIYITRFDVEWHFSRLTIGGTYYTAGTPPPQGNVVSANEISWTSGSNLRASGWQLCFSETRYAIDAVSCDFDATTCGWHFSVLSPWRHEESESPSNSSSRNGFLVVDQPQQSGIFTNLFESNQHFEQLAFHYRSKQISANPKLELRCLAATSALDSFTVSTIWSLEFIEGSSNDDWHETKVVVPAYARGFMFVSAGVEASIDNIYGSSNMEIPSAYLSVGTFVSCMLFVGTETVRCWGAGSFGILGQGSTQNIGDDPDEMGDNLKPIDLGTGRTVKQVACGSAHVCALLDNEVLKCWGYGLEGRLGQGNTKSIGDGPNEMGDNLAPIDLGINRTAKTVAAGEHHTCAILDNDSLKCWGSGSFGKLGQGSTKDIGDDPDEMGDNLEPIDLGTGRTVKQVSLGRDFTCALLDDDSLKCWGYGGNGNLGQGSTEHIGDEPNEMGDNLAPIDLGPNRKVKHVVAGGLHTCVLLHDETVLCWGFARHGQLGRCCAENIGDSEHEMGYSLTAVDLGSMRTAKQITAGYMHTCALLDDHSVKCWGHGVYGQLGQGDNSHLGDDADEMGDLLEPIDFGEDRKARQLASASGYDFHSCVLLDDDSVKCWGWGNAGVLGQGSTDSIGDAMAEMGDFLHPINFGALSTVAQIDIRLFGGSSMRGRLQVLHRDSWRDVCDDNWHGADAQVVCQQLGLAGGVATWRLVGSGQFWMDDVTCVGTEANLGACSFRGWGVHNCFSNEAAGVECHVDAWSHLADPDIESSAGRTEHSAVWDERRGSMLVLGGHASSHFIYYDDLWIYEASEAQRGPLWNQLHVAPAHRHGHTAVFDSDSSTMLIFGGSYTTKTYDELWLYSLLNFTWTLVSSAIKPEARVYHSAVWDGDHQLMLVHAGENGFRLEDLWEFRLQFQSWRQVESTDSPKPSPRSRHSAIWAHVAEAMLVFGGLGASALSDLWHFSLSTNFWTLLSPALAPGSHYGHTAIWDPTALSMLTFGGVKTQNSFQSYSADLWRYSLLDNSWTQMAPPGPYPSPSAREGHTAVFDSLKRHMYVLGGFNASYKNDMWRYKAPDFQEVPMRECSLGQECSMEFADVQGTQSQLVIVESVGLLSGLNDTSFAYLAWEGREFFLEGSNASKSLDWFAEPGIYHIRRCPVGMNASCDPLQEVGVNFGIFIIAGPFSNQSFRCDLGSHCLVYGLQGTRLTKDDKLLAMKECGTSPATSAFVDPQPVHGSYSGLGNVTFDFGLLPLEGFASETVQLCWCSAGSTCSDPEDFRTPAMQLDVTCPPGTYELVGRTRRCHVCPPGYFCPGGVSFMAQLKQCPYGSTSSRSSSSLQACECRRGHFLDVETGSCLPCLIGSYKDAVGPFMCQACPLHTTTVSAGAIAISECMCASDWFDVQPAPDVFDCTMQSRLPQRYVSNDTFVGFASTQRQVYSFNGSISVEGLSLEDLRGALEAYLGEHGLLTKRASFELHTAAEEATDSWVNYEVMSSEEESAAELSAMFEPWPFAAWAFQSSSSLATAVMLNPSSVREQLLECPEGMAFAPGSLASGLADCQCPHGMMPSGSGSSLSTGCVKCPLSFYKASVGDSPCTSCSIGMETLQEGAVSSSACSCSAGFVAQAGDSSTCETCGKGNFCPEGAYREACPEHQTTLVDDAKTKSDCVCNPGLVPSEFGNCAGPSSDHDFTCVRGHLCTFEQLVPFDGIGLSVNGLVSLRHGCGSLQFEQVSPANAHGIATMIEWPDEEAPNSTRFALSFGAWPPATDSVGGADRSLHLDAGVYDLCWCGGPPPCGVGDFVLSAGKLRVQGPRMNQEVSCSVGQTCALENVEFEGDSEGAVIMVLTDCGMGDAIPGFPGQGIAKSVDSSTFLFSDDSAPLSSPPGIYRLCFCMPNPHEDCAGAGSFKAPVGLLTARGPFDQLSECEVDSNCSVKLTGIGLEMNDLLVVTSSCETVLSLSGLVVGSLHLDNSLRAHIGQIPADTMPGVYQMCWCPATSDCSNLTSFRAEAGRLQVSCPKGRYFASSKCALCGHGFYCPGGTQIAAKRFPCEAHETTAVRNATSISDCTCDRGHFYSRGNCAPCPIDYYKPLVGNAPCMRCPPELNTYATGSVSDTSCVHASAVVDQNAVSTVPSLTFNLSLLSNKSYDLAGAGTSPLLVGISRSISQFSRLDANLIDLNVDETQGPNFGQGRRLASSMVVKVTMRYATEEEATEAAQELDVQLVSDEVMSSLRTYPEFSDFLVKALSEPTKSSTIIQCRTNAAKPPGVMIRKLDDCLCMPGFGYEETLQSCELCPLGKYKSTLANKDCTNCDDTNEKSTLEVGARWIEDCKCRAGSFNDSAHGGCMACTVGSYCNGTGTQFECPRHSTTTDSRSRTISDCVCEAGYQLSKRAHSSEDFFCESCLQGFYKPNAGNDTCSLSCPKNALSIVAATSIRDCYCLTDHHAELDDAGNLSRCAGCSRYSGLRCPGHFELAGLHAQPRAQEGWFQTGNTTAVQCLVELPNGASACRGSAQCENGTHCFVNKCVDGSTGMLCGECPENYARSKYLQLCKMCPDSDSGLTMAMMVLADLGRITSLNFAMALLAAQGAGNALKLDSPMIRVVQSWKDACSILLSFNLNRLLPLSSARADTECEECDEQHQQRFQWPMEITAAMDFVLSLVSLVPEVNVDFAIQCHAEALLPGSMAAKRLAPALYYLFLPILSALSTTLLCAFVVYVVVPLAKLKGIHFNDADKETAKRAKYIRKVVKRAHERPRPENAELVFANVLSEILAKNIKDAKQQEVEKRLQDSEVEEILKHVAVKVAEQRDSDVEELLKERAVEAWKSREEGQRHQNRTWSSSSAPDRTEIQLCPNPAPVEFHLGIQEESEREPIYHGCDTVHEAKAAQFKAPVEAGERDFGLFTGFPRPLKLLSESVPVLWLTQLALWPQLLTKFLQMVRCSPFLEEREGSVQPVHRLLPHPDVECYTEDHDLAIVARIGLLVWSMGVPLLLFALIWRLDERQDPEACRIYGYFIQGLDPAFWYWDIVVKRADICLMLVVAYTTLADDDNAKLLLFPLISGLQLGITAWTQPYKNSQAQALDSLEFVLLTSRFVLFSAVAALLIFFPSPTILRAGGASLLAMLMMIVAYSGLHIVAHFVRSAAADLKEIEKKTKDQEPPAGLVARILRFVSKVKGRAVKILEPVLLPDEHLFCAWSLHKAVPALVEKHADRGYSLLSFGGLSARVLKTDMAAQRQTISKAFHDFSLLWMRHSTAKGFPSINMLCALAVTRRDLPRKLSTEELSKSWERTIRALQDDKRNLHLVGQDDAGGAPLCDDDFANAVHYFSLLTKEMAEKVMDAVLSIFECGAGDPEELTHSNVQNHSERTGDECESKMNVAVSSISVNCASSSADVVVVVPDHHPSEVVPFALAEADSLQDAENEVAKPTRRTLRPKQRAKGKAKANPKRGQIGYRRNPNRGMDPRSPSQIQITV